MFVCVQAGMQYALMHKLPGRSLQHLHQLTVPGSLQHLPYQQMPPVQQYPHRTAQNLHAQPTAPATQGQVQVHGYPAPIQATHLSSGHAQQHMHFQRDRGQVHKYEAAQYQPAHGLMHAHSEGQQGTASDQEAAQQGSVEPGDDWIAQVQHGMHSRLLDASPRVCLTN